MKAEIPCVQKRKGEDTFPDEETQINLRLKKYECLKLSLRMTKALSSLIPIG